MCFIPALLWMFLLSGCGHHFNNSRSPLRKPTYHVPTLVISDAESSVPYARTSNYYKRYPIFTAFDQQFFTEHLLPCEGIYSSNGTHEHIAHEYIDQTMHQILAAVRAHEHTFPGCTIIRDANFNYSTGCGLLILKCNQYPFVIKLFKENAESFIQPFSKGFEPSTFFFMAGGSNRHIAGLSRIPNREYLLSRLENNPLWQGRISIPRKWYWVPDPIEWLTIDGYFVDSTCHIQTKIPSMYAIIADYVESDVPCCLSTDTQKKLIISLALACASRLDPHIKNFIIQQKDATITPLITIIDTEDHRCMTGISEPVPFETYFEWYTLLTAKFIKDALFTTKKDSFLDEFYLS